MTDLEKTAFATSLLHFYTGEVVLNNNPMKEYNEAGKMTKEVIDMVYNNQLGMAQDFFEYDLWLNKLDFYIHDENRIYEIQNIVKYIFNDGYSESIITTHFEKHFFDATLTKSNFEFIYSVQDMIKKLKNPRVSKFEVEYIDTIISHKDYPVESLADIYLATGKDKFLPQTAKDVFLF